MWCLGSSVGELGLGVECGRFWSWDGVWVVCVARKYLRVVGLILCHWPVFGVNRAWEELVEASVMRHVWWSLW